MITYTKRIHDFIEPSSNQLSHAETTSGKLSNSDIVRFMDYISDELKDIKTSYTELECENNNNRRIIDELLHRISLREEYDKLFNVSNVISFNEWVDIKEDPDQMVKVMRDFSINNIIG